MSFTLVWEAGAVTGLKRLGTLDRQAVKTIKAAVAGLTEDPRPATSHPLGSGGVHRLHLDDLRVVYEVDEANSAVHIWSVGRVAPGT